MPPPSPRSGCAQLRNARTPLARWDFFGRCRRCRSSTKLLGWWSVLRYRALKLLCCGLDTRASRGGDVAPCRRGARCPRSPFRSRGPNSPRLPPRSARRAVLRYASRFFVGYARHPLQRPAVLRSAAVAWGGGRSARLTPCVSLGAVGGAGPALCARPWLPRVTAPSTDTQGCGQPQSPNPTPPFASADAAAAAVWGAALRVPSVIIVGSLSN